MPRLEIHAFCEEHLDAAGELLAARHRRHRAAERALSARYEDPVHARAEVTALWRSDNASGAVAVADGDVVAYVLGVPKEGVWGENVWVEAAGHAAATAEDLRDTYAGAAAAWVEAGRVRQYVLVPATDAALVDAWFRLGFGQQQAHGVTDAAALPVAAGVRPAEERDVDELVQLAPLVSEHQERSPVFAQASRDVDWAEVRSELIEDLASPEIGNLVAEDDGRIVGNLEVLDAERSSMHASLARPERAAYLAWAATRPASRGSGAGVRLTDACLAWAHERGYESVVTDWRVTNLLASRFWPRRGFRTTFLRLYRHIP